MNLDIKREFKSLLVQHEKACSGSEERRDLFIRAFTHGLKVAFEAEGIKYIRLRETLLKKVKEAMGASYMFPSMDKLKEFLLLLENVDWRPWLHDEKFPKRFRDPLSTLVVLAKGRVL